MSVPAQKRGRSEQAVQTPPEFLSAVQERFGDFVLDLAASNDNAVCARYYGPGSNYPDSLGDGPPWHLYDGLCWLNPPYGNITPWAEKAALSAMLGASIAMLVPASVGAKWFNMWVRPNAYVLELTPRLTFVGHKYQYPKDLILAVFTPERFIGRADWHWRAARVAPANDNGIDPRQLYLPITEAHET